MGWQSDLFCNITFYKQTYNSLYEVDSKIEEIDNLIKYHTSTLKNLALMTEPRKLLTMEEDEDPMYRINNLVEEAIEELEEYYIEKYKLEILRENWSKCHNEEGLAINPPENIKWNSAYLDGDFIKSIKHPNGYE